MPKAKPQWGFYYSPSKDICIHPTEHEVLALMKELSTVLKKDLERINNKHVKHEDNETITFKTFLTNLITEYRQEFLYEQYYPTKASVKETLLYLKKLAKEIEKRFEPLSLDEGIDEDTWQLLEDCLPRNHEGLGRFYKDSITLKNTIDKALPRLESREGKTGRKSGLKDKVWLAKHIAITFEQVLSITPSKTRGGKFDKVLGKVLKACRFEQEGFVVKGYEAEQNFRVIKTALDEIKNEKEIPDPWLINKRHIKKQGDMPTPQYAVIKGKVYIDGKQVKK